MIIIGLKEYNNKYIIEFEQSNGWYKTNNSIIIEKNKFDLFINNSYEFILHNNLFYHNERKPAFIQYYKSKMINKKYYYNNVWIDVKTDKEYVRYLKIRNIQ